MIMEEKTLTLIQECLDNSSNPICMCSFGKDSLVMLHLLRSIRKIPILFFREPFFQKKFAHVQRIAELWDLTLYDYPPTNVTYIQLDDYFEIFNFYYVDGKDKAILYAGIRNYTSDDKQILCAVTDWLKRPTVSSYDFQWDCVFLGHKQTDPVHIADKVQLEHKLKFGKGILCLPMKDWTDKDIWDYIKKYELPYDKKRYDENDESVNPDLFPTCHNCLDYKKKNEKIYCPKNNVMINSIARTKESNLEFRDSLMKILYKTDIRRELCLTEKI